MIKKVVFTFEKGVSFQKGGGLFFQKRRVSFLKSAWPLKMRFLRTGYLSQLSFTVPPRKLKILDRTLQGHHFKLQLGNFCDVRDAIWDKSQLISSCRTVKEMFLFSCVHLLVYALSLVVEIRWDRSLKKPIFKVSLNQFLIQWVLSCFSGATFL